MSSSQQRPRTDEAPLEFQSVWRGVDEILGNNCSFQNSYNNSDRVTSAYRLETALGALNGSLMAVLDVLQAHGVSRCSIEELRHSDSKMRTTSVTVTSYLHALQRAETYADCLASEDNTDLCGTVDSHNLLHYLLLSALNALCRYAQLQYRRAYKFYHGLRLRESSHQQTKLLQSALKDVSTTGEACCACQRQLFLAQYREKQLSRVQ